MREDLHFATLPRIKDSWIRKKGRCFEIEITKHRIKRSKARTGRLRENTKLERLVRKRKIGQKLDGKTSKIKTSFNFVRAVSKEFYVNSFICLLYM